MKQPLTWSSLPEHIRRRLSKEDRRFLGMHAPATAPAFDAPPRHPPDGWRARTPANPDRPPRGYTEHKMQCDLFAWTREEVAAGRSPLLAYLFAVPNAGKRSAAAGRYMRAEGLKPGVPDLFLPVPRAGFCGCVLELKVYPNKPSPEQMAWLDALEAIGHRVALAYSLDTAKTFLASYLSPAIVTPLLP